MTGKISVCRMALWKLFPQYSKDPEFEALAGLLPMEALPYKSK
ncbi:MAG: hypothetical protein V1929_04680 [bacterium]